MGASLTWIAARGATARQVADSLGLKPTSRTAAFGRSPIVGLSVQGWYVVVVQGAEDALGAASALQKLSQRHDVVAGFLEEHVMASHCACWEQGRRRWCVDHRGEEGALHLAASGQVPATFAAIKAAARAQQQAEVEGGQVDHLFDVPLELSKLVSGFRPDEAHGPGEILEESSTRRLWRASRKWRVLLAAMGIMLALGMLAGAVLKLVSWVVRTVAGH